MSFVFKSLALVSIIIVGACASPSSKSSQTIAFASQVNAPKQMTVGNTDERESQKNLARNQVKKPKASSQTPKKLDVEDFEKRSGSLRGRTIIAGSVADIKLASKEVILTFDDGPRPGNTPKILNALDKYGVKATFFMVGSVAKNHSSLVKQVASKGHTVASHTQNHPNLTKLSMVKATSEMNNGYNSVRVALGRSPSRLFRFPYLADSSVLRKQLVNIGLINVAPDIDSKDYFKTSPEAVLQRTMSRLRQRGRGVILFHDIHARTAAMMPAFLKALKAEGYKVVHIKSKGVSRGIPSS